MFRRLSVWCCLVLLAICTAFTFAQAEVETTADLLAVFEKEIGPYESLNSADIGTMECGFFTFTSSDSFYACLDNGDGTFAATLCCGDAAIRYSSLSRVDALRMTYGVSINYTSFPKNLDGGEDKELQVYLDAAVLGEASPTYGNEFNSVFFIHQSIEPLLEAQGIKGTYGVMKGMNAPSQEVKQITSTTQPDALEFSIDYDTAIARLNSVRELLEAYPTSQTGVTADMLAVETDVQIYGVPIADIGYSHPKEDESVVDAITFHVANAAPQRYNNLDQTRKYAFDAFLKLYQALRAKYGDPTDYSVFIINDQSRYCELTDLSHPEVLGSLFMATYTSVTFRFDAFELNAISYSPATDGTNLRDSGMGCYKSARTTLRWNASYEESTSSRELEALPSYPRADYSQEDYSAANLPRLDPRVKALYERCVAGEKLPKQKLYPITKVGSVKVLNKYYNYYQDLNKEYTNGDMRELDLCGAKLFGVRIAQIEGIGSVYDIAKSSALRFYPFRDIQNINKIPVLLQTLYNGMSSSLGKPTGYYFLYKGVEYQLPEKPDFAMLSKLISGYNETLLEIYFGNYILRYDSEGGYSRELMVDYMQSHGVYRTTEANKGLPLLKHQTDEFYKYEKPVYNKETVTSYRERYALVHYFYKTYDPDSAYGDGKDKYAFRDFYKAEQNNPLEFDYGRYGKDDGWFTMAVQIKNTSKVRKVVGFTLAVYCEDPYGNRTYPYDGDYETFTFNKDLKAGAKSYTAPMLLLGETDPKTIHIAFQKVQMSDGTTYRFSDSELEYYYWTN